MTRWVALALGLAIAAVALYLLAGGGSGPAPGREADHIDAASRAKLENVLEEAERAEAARR